MIEKIGCQGVAVGEVGSAEVRRAAGTIESVARTVRAEIPDEVGQIAGGFAGSASAAAGSSLATAWTDAYTRWATAADTHARSMRASADVWGGTDQAVVGRISQRLAGMRAVKQGAVDPRYLELIDESEFQQWFPES